MEASNSWFFDYKLFMSACNVNCNAVKLALELFNYWSSAYKLFKFVWNVVCCVAKVSKEVTNSLYYRALYLFNCLETEVRNYKVKKLSKYLQDNLKYIFPHNKISKLH